MMNALALTQDLIARTSVTPADGGCQALLAQRLSAIGFQCEHLRFGDVDNLWAIRNQGGPLVCFAGHTDVVPTGPLHAWHSDPFVPSIRDGNLYGRGAADMKSSIAAFVIATEQFVHDFPNHTGSIAFLITSDEEGPSINGTVKVVDLLESRGTKIDYCIVGEPSSVNQLGDTIKNGRRGSLSAKLKIHGIQGHVAYPELVKNPIHLAAPALAELVAMRWDQGNEFFPPTSFQISNVHAGTGATNVVPGTLEVDFNLRFSTETTAQKITAEVEALLTRHALQFEIEWNLSGQPFLTGNGQLVQAARAAIQEVTGVNAALSTTGGTSDGRFIARICPQIVELGPVNESIHKLNEHIALSALEQLPKIYHGMLQRLLT
jgi:succinyl-diaminopimelate desuccinylase